MSTIGVTKYTIMHHRSIKYVIKVDPYFKDSNKFFPLPMLFRGMIQSP